MSASQDLQERIYEGVTHPRIVTLPDNTVVTVPPLTCPVLRRRPKELQSDIEEAIIKQVLGVYIQPPLPTSALQGVPFLFFDKFEVRLRVVEQPKLNDTASDAYDVAEGIAELLQWTNPGDMLAYPLAISPRPMEMIEDPTYRIIDVIFNAVLQLNPVPQ